jgi:LacI family transcriptional regulator
VGLLADAVLTDNRAAAHTATRHLLAPGHRRVAHLGDDLAISTARDRRSGFCDAVAEAGPDVAASHADNLRSEAEAEAAVRQLLELADPPTALFTAQNLVTAAPSGPSTRPAGSTTWPWWASTTCRCRTCCSPVSP